MKTWQIALAAIFAGLVIGGAIAFVKMAPAAPPAAKIAIGGPFALLDTEGKAVTDKDLLGKPVVMFFGFTYCPEICPTTLTEMTGWMKTLGKDADRLNVVFVSVDAEAVKKEQLKAYLLNFDLRIRGLTGSPEAVASAAKAYRVYYKKVEVAGGYTVDHSTAILLFDAKGQFFEPIGYGGPPERGLEQIRRLLKR